MEVVRFGRRGRPLIYIPSSGGDQNEFESYGMYEDCREAVESGSLQIFSVDGMAQKTLWNDALPPAERIRAYAAFERYLVTELLPWVAEQAPGKPSVVGASYGGFVAANLMFKRPQSIGLACGLCGVYGLWHRLDGYHDDDVYFHTPLEFLPRLNAPEVLDAIRGSGGMVLYGAARDEWLWSTRDLADVLRRKRLPHAVEIWPAPADHNEQWWKRQLQAFLTRYHGASS